MMEPSLHELELDAEAARTRLTRNLRTLRSPTARHEFTDALKQEAVAVRDDLIDRTRSAAQTGIADWIDDLKARAAENPAAVLAIAAGIGWRLLRDPPISTALVGIGLFSLLRGGAPSRTGLDDRGYVDRAVDNLKQQSHQIAADVADRASVAAAAAGDTVREWSHEAVTAMRETGARVLDTAVGAAATASNSLDASWQASENAVARAAKGIGQVAADMQRTVRDAGVSAAATGQGAGAWISDRDVPVRSDTVNQLLLGAAGAAVAAALGVALQRRMSEVASSD